MNDEAQGGKMVAWRVLRPPRLQTMKPLKAGLAYFALVFGTGFLLGALRVTLLVPRLGERMAELLEMPVMLVVTVLAARFIVRHFALVPMWRSSAATGAVGLALVFAAEISLLMVLQKQSLADYLASRDPVSGGAFLVMLGAFAAMPCLVARRR
jgi:hypothetical protein